MEYANYSEHVHSPSIPDIRSCASMIFILRIHAIGVPEGVTLLEFEGANQEEEPEVQEADEAVAAEDLPEWEFGQAPRCPPSFRAPSRDGDLPLAMATPPFIDRQLHRRQGL